MSERKYYELQNINFYLMDKDEQKVFYSAYKKIFNEASKAGSVLKFVTVNEKYEVPAYLDHKYSEHKAFGSRDTRYRIFLCVENESKNLIQLTVDLFNEYLNVNAVEINEEIVCKYNGDYIVDGSVKKIYREVWEDTIAPLSQLTSLDFVIAVETEFIPLPLSGNLRRIKELSRKKKYKANALKYKNEVLSGSLTFFRVKQTIKVKDNGCNSYGTILKRLEYYYPNITHSGKFKGDAYISGNRCIKFNPFSCTELQDATGFCYGANSVSKNPIFYDRHDNYLPHMLICGQSGSGAPNVAVNEMMQVFESTDDHIIVIDPYENLIHRLRERGCAYYALSEYAFSDKSEAYHINPLDVVFKPQDALDTCHTKGLNTAIAIINGFADRELTDNEEKAVSLSYTEVFKPFVDKLQSEYEAQLLKYQDDFMRYEIDIENNPTIIDVVEVMESKYNEECKDLLELIGKNGTLRKYLELLSFKTKMPNGRFSRFLSLHLMYVPDKISKAFYAAIISYVYNQILMHGDWTKYWIYFDSISLYSKNSKAFCSLFRDLCVQSRRYQGTLTFTEMSFTDVCRSPLAEVIINRVPFYCFLNQSFIDRIYIKERFNLPEYLLDFIRERPCGEGILIADAFKSKGKQIVPVSIRLNTGPITEFEKEKLIGMRKNKHKK